MDLIKDCLVSFVMVLGVAMFLVVAATAGIILNSLREGSLFSTTYPLVHFFCSRSPLPDLH